MVYMGRCNETSTTTPGSGHSLSRRRRESERRAPLVEDDEHRLEEHIPVNLQRGSLVRLDASETYYQSKLATRHSR